MPKIHDQIRTQISANLSAFLRGLPSGPAGAFGDLTIYRYTTSRFGFKSSLAPDHHFVVKVRCHANAENEE